MNIYSPAEDSQLVLKHISEYAIGRILDMGTGSGILAKAAARCKASREVVAADINPEAIANLQLEIQEHQLRKLKAVHSDLFSNIDNEFDLIIFNPPYLPQDVVAGKPVQDVAIYGGKKGWEISERFLKDAARF